MFSNASPTDRSGNGKTSAQKTPSGMRASRYANSPSVSGLPDRTTRRHRSGNGVSSNLGKHSTIGFPTAKPNGARNSRSAAGLASIKRRLLRSFGSRSCQTVTPMGRVRNARKLELKSISRRLHASVCIWSSPRNRNHSTVLQDPRHIFYYVADLNCVDLIRRTISGD
jgi:hypothetical protein